MAHHLQLSLVPNDQTSPSLPLLQAKESIISQSQSDSTTEQGSTSPKRDQDNEEEIESAWSSNEEITILGLASTQVGAAEEPSKGYDEVLAVAEDSGRERLRKHRVEMAGRVWIPDIWGQEEFLKDWVDCTVFDDSLFPNGFMSARSALIEEGRRGTSGRVRIENRC
ncbi:protein BIC1-like [Rosa rugosa]|uniref:protein BIC1-like n=1 Tax=Rosa rugosa TaxID=74645 RepID=UPI002B40E856|nr:protein BIC1-like [Rosa rugosa]